MKKLIINGEELSPPWATALAFSGGKQSSCILWMVLRGDIPRPKNFVVLNADPGMENTFSYSYVNRMESECRKQGIPFLRARRNLYQELVDLKASGKRRFDTPPLWTRNRETGKKGRLLQKCTGAYKIAPMDRLLRVWLEENLGISSKSRRLGEGTIIKWIGFSNDEWMRIKESKQKYQQLEYPLIDLKMGNAQVDGYFLKHGIQAPPRSVCNACFANDVPTFKEMHDNRPYDWAQAVRIDETVRDLRQIGVKDECFVSSTLIPLRELAERGFILNPREAEQDAELCHSGHCFT